MEVEAMRDIVKVIEMIQAVLPPTRIGMKGDLDKVKRSAMFTAPEAMAPRWEQLAEVMNSYITPDGVLHYEWMVKAAAIFADRSTEEIVAHARTHRG